MKKKIESYPIQKGMHCASTSLSEIMKYNNYDFSEALVFGISSGLDFVYITQRYVDCPRLVFTRTPMLENEFFSNIGIDFKWNNSIPQWEMIKKHIDNKSPILFLTDPSKIGFFQTNIPSVTGHTLTIIGYKEVNNERIVYISDFISNKILRCTYHELLDSINVRKAPFYKENLWGHIPPIYIGVSLDKVIIGSIKKNAKRMLDCNNTNRGLIAINTLTDEIKYWRDLPNYRFLCSHVYHSIETIGTGGSGFRNLYTLFLREIGNYISVFDSRGYSETMYYISICYKRLAKYFYLESLGKDKSYVNKIHSLLEEIYEKEHRFWSNILLAIE